MYLSYLCAWEIQPGIHSAVAPSAEELNDTRWDKEKQRPRE
jgi:hypothetical protein